METVLSEIYSNRFRWAGPSIERILVPGCFDRAVKSGRASSVG